MLKKIEPSEIGKKPSLISKAQQEMAKSDVLVCGKCHNVFHIIDSFQEHKNSNCKKLSAFADSRETRPKIWAYLLWKQTYLHMNPEITGDEENPWKLYQQWMKIDESTRQSWLVAGGTIQSFDKFGSGTLQETPVKITKTVTPDKPVIRASPGQQIMKRPIPSQQARPNVVITENRIIKQADNSQRRGPRMINRTDPVSGVIEKASIEKIMAKRMNPRKKENEYLVKWETKPQTWEPASHLDSCKDLIENFEVLLAKQKEMRAKTQLQAQQQQVAQPQATSTPTAAPVANRPVRFSKEKAINQVKQWTGSNKQVEEAAEVAGKRKLEEDDEFDEDDCDDIDDEDYELESSWEKKKMAQQLGQTSVKRMKTDLNQNGNVRVINKSSDMQIGATVVRRVTSGPKSPDVIIANQKQQSGVFKKASPGQVVSQKRPGEGQVRIVAPHQQIKSGIVRVQPSGGTPGNKPNVVTRVVSKVPGQPIRNSPGTGTVVRTVQSVQSIQNQQRTLAQKIIQRSPIAGNKASPVGNRASPAVQTRQPIKSPQGQTIVRKAGSQQQVVTRRGGANTPVRVQKKAEDEDDGVPDPFPKDLPPIEAESASPPPPMTLCPITGKVLSESEVAAAAATEGQEAESEATDQQHQITQLLSNEDGSPIYITGDDGTMYQVAGKNANGETILVSTNAEGEQTCILLPADQDLLAGLPGIQTTDATEAALEGNQMSVEAAVAEAVGASADEAVTGSTTESAESDFQKEGDEGSQEGNEEATQPLSIAVGGEGGESQDGQITAEIVQADEPSPGGTRKVVLMLPDGNLMVTELSSDQFQSLNIQQ